ncbi:MAG: ParB/RepB/Spo0J family partition protein [Solobacterium sp.]|nr:ParB/RepB/Spo0J family partition protein [Solobacterium sp.]
MAKSIFDFFEKDDTGKVVQIPVSSIEVSRYQPRVRFDERAMEELTDSIRTNGLIQPITVREVGDHYEIIAGERRYRACVKAGYETIACYILSPTEDQAAEMALIENIQREDLTAVEEAKGYVQIMRQAKLTQEEVARRIGKSQSSVANKIRLLNLPQEVQDAVADRELSERHARALLALKPEKQAAAYHYVADRNLNVRQTEAYVERISEKKPRKKKGKTKGFTRNTQIGINSVNQCVRMIKKMGIDVVTETEETLTDVRVIVRFPK